MSEPASRATAVKDRPKPAAPPQSPAANTLQASARPVPGGGEPAPSPADAAVHGVLARHWNTLGLRPTMDLSELETSFYFMVERYPRNPTEEEEARLVEMQQAYAVLRRALEKRPPAAADAGPAMPRFETRQRVVACIGAAVGLLVLFYLNFGTIKLHATGYGPDTVVRLAGKSQPYGTVIRFDPAHAFAVGPPTRAYQLKLAGNDEVVWLSERIVEKGMVPVK